MPLPGYEVGVVDQQQGRTATASTSTTFLVSFAHQGPTDAPVLIRTPRQLTEVFGPEVPYSALHTYFEFLKREGAGAIYVKRLVGPDAAAAHVTLNDADGDPSVSFTASSVGEWANGATGGLSLDPEATATPGEVKLLLKLAGSTVAVSPTVTNVAGLAGWTTKYGGLNVLGTALPAAAAPAPLAGGDDDRENATPLEWADAEAAIRADYGPGQLVLAGNDDLLVHVAALEHGDTRNRYALLDAPVDTVDEIEEHALTLRLAGNGRHGSLVTPPLVAPTGVSTTTVPASLLVAATNARTDVAEGPGQPGAGIYGEAQYALDVTVRYTDAERERLNNAGVIVIQMVNGKPRVYGNRSLADPVSEPGNQYMAGSRVIMGLKYELGQVLEQYVLRRIDAGGRLLAQLADDLAAVCERWRVREDLFGNTPAEAYSVDTGPDVNDPVDLAAGQLSAAVAVRIPGVAERVVLTITKVATGDQIAA
jgi:hypothetical protein